MATAMGLASAILVGLAAYYTKELLAPEQEKRWVRARSAAEAFKSETHLFLTLAPPYDTPDAAQKLMKRVEALTVDNVRTSAISPEEKRKRLHQGPPYTIDDYIKNRVQDQIDWYHDKADLNANNMARGRQISLGLGALAVVLGALGGLGNQLGQLGEAGVLGAWVAVITTMTTAIAAYVYANRFQYLSVSYQATGRRLETLLTNWRISGKTDADKADRDQLILDCENVISVENSAWMAEWTEKAPPEFEAAAPAVAPPLAEPEEAYEEEPPPVEGEATDGEVAEGEVYEEEGYETYEDEGYDGESYEGDEGEGITPGPITPGPGG